MFWSQLESSAGLELEWSRAQALLQQQELTPSAAPDLIGFSLLIAWMLLTRPTWDGEDPGSTLDVVQWQSVKFWIFPAQG